MTIKQCKDGTFIAVEFRDGVHHIVQSNTQDGAYYGLCRKLDKMFSDKADRMIEEAIDGRH